MPEKYLFNDCVIRKLNANINLIFNSKDYTNPVKNNAQPIQLIPKIHNKATSADSKNLSDEKKIRVLVVEDDPIAQNFHEKMLMEIGCLVHTVENAEQATAILLHNSYDLILLDICLADKNGYELAVEIRNRQEIKPIIAAVTINSDKHMKLQCQAAGIDQVFCKPLSRKKVKLILGNISNGIKNRVLKPYPEQVLLNHYAVATKNAPKPDTMSNSQYFNYLAIQLLEEMGNEFPTQVAIDCVESFIKRYSRRKLDNR